jgi:ubiquinone/menaquinone biosynthesis C-methylase UbiE
MESDITSDRYQSQSMKKPLESSEAEQPWDRAAQGWNLYSAMIAEWLKAASTEMLSAARIGPGMAVLDIAAGAGDQTLDIAHLVGPTGRVVATDLSPMILKLAHEKFHRQGYQHVETQVLDAQRLGLSGANFDAAVCRLGLMFCNAPHDALLQAWQALKPGGYYAALVFSGPQANPCLVITLACALHHAGLEEASESGSEPGGLMSLGAPALLDELLRSAGYVHVKVRTISAPLRLDSVDVYIGFLRSAASPIIEILSKLSPAAQKAAWSDMAQRLSHFNHAGGWTGPNELLLCEAQRPMSTKINLANSLGELSKVSCCDE